MNDSLFQIDRPVLVLGAGGHAKVLTNILCELNVAIVGVVDTVLPPKTSFQGVPIIGDDASIFEYPPNEIYLVNGVGALPGKNRRWELALEYRSKGYKFARLVHPAAVVAHDVDLQEGVQIMPGVVLEPGVSVGKDSIINTHSSIDHDCKIGDRCHIAPGVVLAGGVHIENDVHVGVSASITQNVCIGRQSIIGAGSIILKDVDRAKKIIQKRNNYIVDSGD